MSLPIPTNPSNLTLFLREDVVACCEIAHIGYFVQRHVHELNRRLLPIRLPGDRSIFMDKKFKREISALDDIFGFVDNFIASNGIGDAAGFSTRLAVEETFTNLVRHNSGGLDHIFISLNIDRDTNRLIIQLKDFNVENFDKTKIKSAEVHLPLSEKKIGGLGTHLIKNAVDTIKYDYKNRTLCITAIKNLEEKDV